MIRAPSAAAEPQRLREMVLGISVFLLDIPIASRAMAQVVTPQDLEDQAKRFTQSAEMIPMRDGVKLHTTIFAPKDVKAPLPFILLRTPHGIESRGPRALKEYLKDLADEGYIFVFQDIRGRHKSEGQFVMSRPPRNPKNAQAIDEGTDTNDTIDWLLKNVKNHNGRVGMLGISYPGWLTVMALLDPHPALKAASPQASPADMFIGDDFHHNGAFRLSYGFEYVAQEHPWPVWNGSHPPRQSTQPN